MPQTSDPLPASLHKYTRAQPVAPTPMKLDVVVPTYNRRDLLGRTLASLSAATLPPNLTVAVIVVDNNSVDDTETVVRDFAAQSLVPVHYVRETRQGLSHARNAGIAAGDGELIGFIDDDEEIEAHWYEVVAREFADPATEFIGGPYLANWVSPTPDWLPPGYHAAIGAIPPKPRSPFAPEFGANLMGGNAVIRRGVFDRIGGYSTRLGRSGTGLLSEEDAEFLRRLYASGVRGVYVPDLTILHYIDPKRLTRSYHRRWCYWRGVSQGVLARETQEPVAHLFGVPRHLFGRALRGLVAIPKLRFTSHGKASAFASELASWDLLGFLYGRHWINIDKLYADKAAPAKTAATAGSGKA